MSLEKLRDRQVTVFFKDVTYEGTLRKLAHHERAWCVEVERDGRVHQVQFLDFVPLNVVG